MCVQPPEMLNATYDMKLNFTSKVVLDKTFWVVTSLLWSCDPSYRPETIISFIKLSLESNEHQVGLNLENDAMGVYKEKKAGRSSKSDNFYTSFF